MANVPLEQTVRRYPAPYQDEMNGLNNQMSGMSVTQSGFNKLWVYKIIFVIFFLINPIHILYVQKDGI